MITGIFGGPGSGKSLYALFLIEQAVRAGRPVYTNIVLTDECPFQDRCVQLDTPDTPIVRGAMGKDGKVSDDYECFWHYIERDAVVVIDEANIYFDASDFGDFSRDARQFHQQHRKFGIDVVYLCQNLPNMWVRIRRLIGRFIVCEWNYRTSRLFNTLPITWSRFLRSEFGDEQFKEHWGDGFFTYKEAQRMFSWYRTEQILGDTSFYRSLNGYAHAGSATGAEGRTGGHVGGGEASGVGAQAQGQDVRGSNHPGGRSLLVDLLKGGVDFGLLGFGPEIFGDWPRASASLLRAGRTERTFASGRAAG